MPAVGEVVTVRYTGRGRVRRPASRRWCGTSAACRPRAGRSRGSGSRWCPTRRRSPTSTGARASATRAPRRCAAFAAASCPWFFGETLHFRIVAVGAGGMTLRTTHADPPLLPRRGARLRAAPGVDRRRARPWAADVGAARRRRRRPRGRRRVGRPAARAAQRAVALSAGRRRDAHARGAARRRPRRPGRRAGGHLRLRHVGAPTTRRSSPCACTPTRPRATSTARRSPTCARRSTPTRATSPAASAGGSSATLRVIFVDGDPARSQYVALGGHEVPQWLWDAGFVEGGAGATHPDFQRAGLYVPLMQHLFRVAVQSGHRYVLGACPDELARDVPRHGLRACSRTRTVEPKPGWRFRSHLLYADAERLLRDDARVAGPSPPWRPPSPSPACRPRPERGSAMSHDLASELAAAAARRDVTTFRADAARRAGPGHRGRARRAGRGSDRRGRRRAGRAARAARPGPRARRAARGARLRDAVERRAGRPRAGRASARGPSIRGAAGWCTSCPSRCTASCAWTATATRSPTDEQERLARALRGRRRPVGRARGGVDDGARGHRRRAAAGRLRRARPLEPQPGGRAASPTSASARSCWPRARSPSSIPYIRVVAYPGRRRGDDHRRVRRRRRRGRRRVRRPGDEGAPARARARRGPARGHGHEPSRDARRRALRPRAATGRPFHGLLGDVTSADARRPDDQAEGPVRDPHPRPGEPHGPGGGVDGRGQGDASRRGRSSRPTSRSAARWWPTPCGGSRSASSPRSGRFYADLDDADRRRAPGAAGAGARRPSRRRAGRRRHGCRPPAPGRRRPRSSASSSPARARRRPAGTCSRGASRRGRTSSARGSTRRGRRCWTSATARRCSRSAPRSRRRRSAPARSASSRRAGRSRRTARCGSSRSSAGRHARDEEAVEAAVAALLQPAHRRRRRRSRRPSSRGSRAAARRSTRASSAGDALAELGTALGALDRVRFLSPRLRRDLIGELRFTAAGGACLARRHRRRLARARRRRPRGDGRPAHRRRAWTSSRGWTAAGASATPPATRSPASAGAIVLRAAAVDRAALARRRPRAHAAVARGHAPRAGRPSVGLAVPLPAPARGRRLAGGVGAHGADRRGRRVRARRRRSTASARSCSSCGCRAGDPPSVRSLRRPVDEVLAFAA